MPEMYADTLTTAPSVEPVSLDEAKRACDEDDNYRDAEFESWIKEARQVVEHDARLALINQTRTLYLHGFPPYRSTYYDDCSPERPAYSPTPDTAITLHPVAPLSSVTSIQYLDTAGSLQTLSTDVYKVDSARKPAKIWLKYGQSWPSTYDEANAVTITYVAGYGSTAADVPEMAKRAILYLVRHRYDNPDMVIDSRTYSVDETYCALVDRLKYGSYP